MKRQLLKITVLLLFNTINLYCFGENANKADCVVDSITSFSLIDNSLHFIATKASINNGEYGEFILDTGTTNGEIVIDSAFFYSSNIDTTKLKRIKPRIRMIYWQAFYEGDIKIQIGTHFYHVKRIEVNNQKKYFSDRNWNLKGLIGVEPFLNSITTIDFNKNIICFNDSLRLDSGYIAIPLYNCNIKKDVAMNQKFVYVDGLKDNSSKDVKGFFLLDTGNSLTGLMLKGSFADRLQTPLKTDENETGYPRWRLNSLYLGGIELNNVPLRRMKKGSFDVYEALEGGDGLLGMPILKRFNMILDYKNNVLYLKPNKWFELKNKK